MGVALSLATLSCTQASVKPTEDGGTAGPPVLVAADGSTQIEVDIDEVFDLAAVPLPDGFSPAGSGFELAVPDGAATEPLTVRLPGEEPPPDARAVIVHINDAGAWEAEAADYVDGNYVGEASSFSLRVPGWITSIIDSPTDWLTGRTDPPVDCELPVEQAAKPEEAVYRWVAAGSSPADGTFHACVKKNPLPGSDVERVEIKIKSNRSMAMWIVIPDYAYDYLWVEGFTDWLTYGTLLAEMDQAFGQQRVLLPPGRTMTLGYHQPSDNKGVRLDFSSYQTTTSQIFSLVYKYVGEVGRLGAIVSLFNCTIGQATGQDDTRLSNITMDILVECLFSKDNVIGTSAKTAIAVLQSRYETLVREGRFRLSNDAASGIEQLVARGQRMQDSIAKINTALSALRAAKLLADAASMAQDSLLAFTPGLNAYTVFLIASASGAPPATEPAPAMTLSPDGLGPLRVGMALEQAVATGLIDDFEDGCPLSEGSQYADLKPPLEGVVGADDGVVSWIIVVGGSVVTSPGGVAVGDSYDKAQSAFSAAGYSVTLDKEAEYYFGSYFIYVTKDETSQFGGSVDPDTMQLVSIGAPLEPACE